MSLSDIALWTITIVGILLLPNVLLSIYVQRLQTANSHRRVTVLQSLRVTSPESKRLVGFFHPYWYVPLLPYLCWGSV